MVKLFLMKVKLLKKIRKRYSITYYPDGGFVFGGWESIPFILLEDNNNSFRNIRYSLLKNYTKEMVYISAWEEMRKWIRKDYKTERKRRNIKVEKLWFSK